MKKQTKTILFTPDWILLAVCMQVCLGRHTRIAYSTDILSLSRLHTETPCLISIWFTALQIMFALFLHGKKAADVYKCEVCFNRFHH